MPLTSASTCRIQIVGLLVSPVSGPRQIKMEPKTLSQTQRDLQRLPTIRTRGLGATRSQQRDLSKPQEEKYSVVAPNTADSTKLIVEYKVMKTVPFLGRDITHYGILSPPLLRDRRSRARGHQDPGFCHSCPQVIWQCAGLLPVVHIWGEVLRNGHRSSSSACNFNCFEFISHWIYTIIALGGSNIPCRPTDA